VGGGGTLRRFGSAEKKTYHWVHGGDAEGRREDRYEAHDNSGMKKRGAMRFSHRWFPWCSLAPRGAGEHQNA
jgi:hypothetical protein